MPEDAAERYWDARARENALFFVDNELDPDTPDVEAFWRGGEVVVQRMLSDVSLRLRGDEAVLDVGCGVGRTSRALAARTGQVCGLDVSREMLSRAEVYNAELPNITWLHGDGRTLNGVDDESVDGCFSHVVFQHIPDPAMTLGYVREMARVLRPGGWALFQFSSDPSVHRRPTSPWVRVRSRVRRNPAQADERAWWGSAVPVQALHDCAENSGMRIEQLLYPGTQYTTVLARKSAGARGPV